MDNHEHTIGVFLDYSKAFDTVDHLILLRKLYHYGIRGVALRWFESYLGNRRQFVSIDSASSGHQRVTCGVPQGSLLGPLLFIVYINDFQHSSNILSTILFADDSSVFVSHKNPSTLLDVVNSELCKVTLWIQANKLSLNLQKTNYMLFSNSINSLPGEVSFNGVQIKKVSSTKFLGLYIDDKLTWKYHIDHLCKLVSRNVGVIHKLKCVFPEEILVILYSSLILPYLNYGILAWGNTFKTQLERLFLVQKRAIRTISNASFRAHTDNLFYEHGFLKVEDLFHLQLGSLMYNLVKGTLPVALASIFVKNNQVHDHKTRQSSKFHLPRCRTQFMLNTLVSTGPRFWNSLDENVTQAASLCTFKRKLKLSYLAKYCILENNSS